MERYLSLAFVVSLLCCWSRADICQQPQCTFDFEVHRARTMVITNDVSTFEVGWNGTNLVTVENDYQTLERFPDDIGQAVDPEDFIMADGYRRDVIAINGQMPGPQIEVMEGAEIVVNVYNNMLTEALSIHWHGMTQRRTPYMDGAAPITQCPILPQQKFQYKFTAEPAGTHWYHASFANQRISGLFGMIIVHKQLPTLPEISLSVTDWFQQDALTIDLTSPYRLGRPGAAEFQAFLQGRDYSVDSVEVTSILYQSTLLGGRGRWNGDAYPLREYTVTGGSKTRFRMVNAAMEHSYEISIDNHQLSLVALDGGEIHPLTVDSVMIHPGERVDFEVQFDQTPDRYWLRSRTIREHQGFDEPADGIVKGVNAVIIYDTATSGGDPTTSRKVCTEADPCVAFGCPFDAYPEGDGRRCLHLEDATSTASQHQLDCDFGILENYQDVDERFLNFAFVVGSSIQAKKLILPRAPLHQRRTQNYTVECTDTLCAFGCKCTHIQSLDYRSTVQMVFLSYEPTSKYMAHHVAHLHGHNFAVLAVGYPPQNTSTAQWTGQNPNITCDAESSWRCENPFWTNGPPALNTVNPPIKDTVLIPARGYVVVRFKANNPGYWLLRNMREMPFMEGMAMIFNEAENRHRRVPARFPQCYDYNGQNGRRHPR